MSPHRCTASKVLEFLVSRSLLSRKWASIHADAIERLSEVSLLIQSIGINAQARDFVIQKQRSGERVELSEINHLLEILKSGEDGKARRWWIVGAYTSPIIQGLREIKQTYVRHNLEQAELCQKLREYLLQLRDIQRDLIERKSALVEVSDRIDSNNALMERDRDELTRSLNKYGLTDIDVITKIELDTKVRLFCQERRTSLEQGVQELLRDPALTKFITYYNEKFDRNLKIDVEMDTIKLTVEELGYYARISGAEAIGNVINEVKTRMNQIESIDSEPLVQEVWNLYQRIDNNKTVARLSETESKLRASIQQNEESIPQLRKEIRDLADRAQESISRIFPQGLEIVID
jgi:hypothetical protein